MIEYLSMRLVTQVKINVLHVFHSKYHSWTGRKSLTANFRCKKKEQVWQLIFGVHVANVMPTTWHRMHLRSAVEFVTFSVSIFSHGHPVGSWSLGGKGVPQWRLRIVRVKRPIGGKTIRTWRNTECVNSSVSRCGQKFLWMFPWLVGHLIATVQPGKKKIARGTSEHPLENLRPLPLTVSLPLHYLNAVYH